MSFRLKTWCFILIPALCLGWACAPDSETPFEVIELATESLVDTLHINIKEKHYLSLAATREAALAEGRLESGTNEYTKATLTLNGEMTRVKVRLKGD
jgi:hypothetical protein